MENGLDERVLANHLLALKELDQETAVSATSAKPLNVYVDGSIEEANRFCDSLLKLKVACLFRFFKLFVNAYFLSNKIGRVTRRDIEFQVELRDCQIF